MTRNIGQLFTLMVLFAAWQFGPGSGWALAEGTFYVAPKVMFGQQKADFGAPAYEIKEAPGPVTGGQPKFPNKYPAKALNAKDSLTFGALAFGVDLHDRFEVPLRLELEISTRADAKTRGEIITHYEDLSVPPENSGDVRIGAKSLAYTMHTAFVNVYADLHNDSAFTPYIGGGLGAAFIKGRATVNGSFSSISMTPVGGRYSIGGGDVDFTKRVTQFAWHLDAGLSYDLTEKMAVDLSYRYLDVGKSLKLGDKPHLHLSYRDDGSGTGGNVDAVMYGPSEINFDPTHQVVLGFRYSFK